MLIKREELASVIGRVGGDDLLSADISSEHMEVLKFLKKNLSDARDREDIFDFSIDAINRSGFEFSFIAVFREDRKYSSAVRIRVDSELVNRVEDYARKMMPNLTVMRYRIPIYEDGRIFKKFLLESKKPLVTDNIEISNKNDVISASLSDLFNNLISKDSPLVLLLPAFKRLVPYKYAMSTQILIDETVVGNIGVASIRELTEGDLNLLMLISKMMSDALGLIGFGRDYL